MPSLFLALLTSALAMLGGRSALLTARLSRALGARGSLLAVCWITAIATSAFAAWAGGLVGPLLAPEGKTMFVAAALAVAALELLFVRARAAPAEPTRSLPAVFLVLLAQQFGDAARFFVLVLGVAAAGAPFAAVGGALGSGAVLTAAWALGREWEMRLPLRAIRLTVGALFAVAAVVVALSARGIIG